MRLPIGAAFLYFDWDISADGLYLFRTGKEFIKWRLEYHATTCVSSCISGCLYQHLDLRGLCQLSIASNIVII